MVYSFSLFFPQQPESVRATLLAASARRDRYAAVMKRELLVVAQNQKIVELPVSLVKIFSRMKLFHSLLAECMEACFFLA